MNIFFDEERRSLKRLNIKFIKFFFAKKINLIRRCWLNLKKFEEITQIRVQLSVIKRFV